MAGLTCEPPRKPCMLAVHLLGCHDRARTGATSMTHIGQQVDHAKSASGQSRLRVAVIDVAASSGGALSILQDFTCYLTSKNTGVDWVLFVSSDAISSRVPWVRIVHTS